LRQRSARIWGWIQAIPAGFSRSSIIAIACKSHARKVTGARSSSPSPMWDRPLSSPSTKPLPIRSAPCCPNSRAASRSGWCMRWPSWSASSAARCLDPLAPCARTGRRHWLDRASPGAALYPGIWVGRELRGLGRRDCRRVRQELRSGAGAPGKRCLRQYILTKVIIRRQLGRRARATCLDALAADQRHFISRISFAFRWLL
jgi:hypothetical protein